MPFSFSPLCMVRMLFLTPLFLLIGCSNTDPALLGSTAGGAAGGALIGQMLDEDLGAPIGAGIGALVGAGANQATGAYLRNARQRAREEGRREARAEMLDQEWQRRAIDASVPGVSSPTASAPNPRPVALPGGVYEGVEFTRRHDLPLNGEPVR